ncbi:MAG TPA: hypothetical protein ENJ82_10340 [Bacteroidetes bacterium]|nr:hypothetical protein [Bacteroidota bacterium]
MSNPLAKYTFLPYLRTGLAASIQVPDDPAAPATGRVTVDVEVKINNDSHEGLTKQVNLIGPGDINGIQLKAIVRTSPPTGTQNFEPNYFPFIEFFEEDFLWRYTPAAPVAEKLRPWLFLLVLKREEFSYTASLEHALPAIKINPDGLLHAFPQGDEHWAWAHVQANPDLVPDAENSTTSLHEKLAADPRSAICRLMGSRQLDPYTQYSVFLAPAFEAGRLTGLRIPNDNTPIQQSAFGADEFPYYYTFDFSTGANEDFESLVRDLQPQAIDPAVGKEVLNISNPGLGISVPAEGRFASLQGALLPPLGENEAPWVPLDDAGAAALAPELIPILNEPAKHRENGPAAQNPTASAEGLFINGIFGTGNPAHAEDDPAVAPPLYGEWYTDRDRLDPSLPANLADLDWFHQLNLDAGMRAAAGLGAEVVRRNQQTYVQQCWEQVGELLEANRKIRQIQLGREASEAMLNKHLRNQSAETLLAMTHKFHDRIPAGTNTVRAKTRLSVWPVTIANSNVRRLLRPHGPINKRLAKIEAQNQSTASLKVTQRGLLSRLGNPNDDLVAVKTWAISTEQSRIAISELRALTDSVAALASQQLIPSFLYSFSFPIPLLISNNYLSLALNSLRYYDGFFDEAMWPGTPVSPPFEAQEVQTEILAQFSPLRRFSLRIGAMLELGGDYALNSELELPTLWTSPQLDAPTYAPLVDLSANYLLPNMEKIPDNSVSIMRINRSFMEAYLAGMNHEMVRELMWREFPTKQQGTIFRYFWDHADFIDSSLSEAERLLATRDILDMENWDSTSKMGAHAQSATPDMVLVIRGELLRKYPNTVIYAAMVDPNTHVISGQSYPVFTAKVDPDIVLLGFALDEAVITAPDSNWYFMLQERPGEPRFGLDVAPDELGTPPTSFNELSWGDVGLSAGHLDLDHADGRTEIAGQVATWGNTAADMAHIFYQDPVRIAIHAPDLVTPPVSNILPQS